MVVDDLEATSRGHQLLREAKNGVIETMVSCRLGLIRCDWLGTKRSLEGSREHARTAFQRKHLHLVRAGNLLRRQGMSWVQYSLYALKLYALKLVGTGKNLTHNQLSGEREYHRIRARSISLLVFRSAVMLAHGAAGQLQEGWKTGRKIENGLVGAGTHTRVGFRHADLPTLPHLHEFVERATLLERHTYTIYITCAGLLSDRVALFFFERGSEPCPPILPPTSMGSAKLGVCRPPKASVVVVGAPLDKSPAASSSSRLLLGVEDMSLCSDPLGALSTLGDGRLRSEAVPDLPGLPAMPPPVVGRCCF